MLLNSQFIVVLNGIICYCVQFWNNSLLVLKWVFRTYFSQVKKYKGFPVTGR